MYDPRAFKRSLLDRLCQPVVCSPTVSNCREAPHEHALQDGNGTGVEQTRGHERRLAKVRTARGDVNVAVDHAGHHRHPVAVDLVAFTQEISHRGENGVIRFEHEFLWL